MKNSAAREFALQILYSREINPGAEDFKPVDLKVSEAEQKYARELVQIIETHPEIDSMIAGHLEHWSMSQLNVVDKNILRIAIAELHYGSNPQLNKNMVINEAVELAKIYGGEKSYSFINGVLNEIFKEK